MLLLLHLKRQSEHSGLRPDTSSLVGIYNCKLNCQAHFSRFAFRSTTINFVSVIFISPFFKINKLPQSTNRLHVNPDLNFLAHGKQITSTYIKQELSAIFVYQISDFFSFQKTF